MPFDPTVADRIDAARHEAGFLGVAELAAKADEGVLAYDPYSTLVSRRATLGRGIVIWPGVVIQLGTGGEVSVASGSVLFPNTRIAAEAGRIAIGACAEIGSEGGFTLQVSARDAQLRVGTGARLVGGGCISGTTDIGDGAQVIGPIRVQDCRLEGGGTYAEPDPDRRGGVLKGCGVARGLFVPCGHVIQAFGLFAEAPLRQQTYFHPRQPESAVE